MSTIIFLRHGKTRVDAQTPISTWELSDIGREQAARAAEESFFQDVDIIITSTEQKAMDTVLPLAHKLGKQIITYDDLSELNRDAGGFMGSETYEKTAEECLRNPEVSVARWEKAGDALARFSRRVEAVEREHPGKKILIVGHGYTMNLYFAQLSGELDRAYDRLHTNDFCDWGVVVDGKITKQLGPSRELPGERLK